MTPHSDEIATLREFDADEFSPLWLARALARYDSDDLITVVLTRGQVGAVLGLVNVEADRLEAKGHVAADPSEGEVESGVLKHLLGIEAVIQDAVAASQSASSGVDE